jgi:DNA processing protein
MIASHCTDIDETRAWLTLLRAPGLGAAALRQSIDRYASAIAVVERLSKQPELPQAVRAYLSAPDSALIENDLIWLGEPHRHLVTWNSPDYPALLRAIPSAPAALFIAGDPNLLWSPQLAIIGSRNATAAGLATTRSFAKAFAQTGIVITSGLADGIDGAAHAATLDAGGSTIAVMGTGPDLVYPRKHGDLANRIRAQGALVSEFLPGTPGRPEHFPRRNRIISGLSLGTLVVEASLQSGSLITARLAAEQGREVFAIPGSIHNPLARGCHRLLREGAKLVETAEEVIGELGALAQTLKESLRQRLNGDVAVPDHTHAPSHHDDRKRDPDYVKLLAALGHDPVGVDQLAQRSGLTVAAISSMLLLLELDGVVVAERSGGYSRVAAG